MFSAILSGPIWVEIVAALLGKALITGGLTVIKEGPKIKKLATKMIEEGQKEITPETVIDVFKGIK